MIADLFAEDIAAMALTELEMASGETMPGDKNNLAVFYAKRAYGDLDSHREGFNPLEHATFTAEEAAVEYVKARLSGQSAENSGAYLQKKQFWAHKAAIEASETYNEKKENERVHLRDRI